MTKWYGISRMSYISEIYPKWTFLTTPLHVWIPCSCQLLKFILDKRTSSSVHIYTPRPNNQTVRNFVVLSVSSIWNSLPNNIKQFYVTETVQLFIYVTVQINPIYKSLWSDQCDAILYEDLIAQLNLDYRFKPMPLSRFICLRSNTLQSY